MATNHTENYALNLWEPTDKFVRDEFNQDNAKIDAALACHPSAELIASVTVEEPTPVLDLDISQVDWDRYMMVVLIIKVAQEGYISLNTGGNNQSQNLASNTVNSMGNILKLEKANHMTALFPVFYSGDRLPTAIGFGSGAAEAYCCLSAGGGQKPWKQCGTIAIRRNYDSIASGDSIELWGVK